MLRKLVVMVAIAAYMVNNLAYAYTDDDYVCQPNYFTKCKIQDGKEYVMSNSLAEQKYPNLKQTAGEPIVIFPAQLKYPLIFNESYLGKPKNSKQML